MKKKILIFLFVFLFVFPFAYTVNAVSREARLVDEADLLTFSEETKILTLLNGISERQQLDIVVVTVKSLNGKSPRAFADDYYDDHGYGFGSQRDGVLLLIAMDTRDYYISTSGYGIEAFTDKRINRIKKSVQSDLSDGEYAAAFEEFATLCDDYITQTKSGNPDGNYNVTQHLLLSLAIGLIVALIATGIMRRKLKSVRFKTGASDYMKKGSFVVTKSNDIYLYKHVTRRAKPKDSDTHRSSSGRSHGGGGGKF